MWTPATRAQHTRVAKRYQTDLSDAEWRLIAAFLPEARSTGRRREWPMREIVNAIFYVLRGGITWRLLPKDFPPWQTVYRWFARLRDEAVFERMNHALVMADRERTGREASPSAAIIDSQSVKTTESGGPRGYVRHARASDAILEAKRRGLAPSDEQRRELGAARRAFDEVRPHGWQDAEAAYSKDNSLAREAGTGRIDRAVRALQLETEIRTEPQSRADRFVERFQELKQTGERQYAAGDYSGYAASARVGACSEHPSVRGRRLDRNRSGSDRSPRYRPAS